MVNLTQSAERSAPSIYRECKALFDKLEASGKKVINFTIGSPTQPVHDEIINDAQKHLETYRGKAVDYTNFQGHVDLRKEIIGIFNEQHSTNYGPENIVLTVGANDAIRQGFHNLVEKEAPCIIPIPGFLSYVNMLKEDSRHAYLVSTADNNYVLDFNLGGKLDRATEELHAKYGEPKGISKKDFVVTLVFSDPNNPTGYKHSEEEIKLVHGFLNKWPNMNIICDSLYHGLIYDPKGKPSLFDSLKGTRFEDNVIYVDSMSKVDSLAGERCGLAISKDPKFAASIANLQLNGSVHPSWTSQVMLLSALKNRDKYIGMNSDAYSAKTDFVYESLKPSGIMNYKPNASFYSLIDLSFMSDMQISKDALESMKKFYPNKDISDYKEIRNNPFLAAYTLSERAGIVPVPLMKPAGEYITYFSEDAMSKLPPLARIVPTNSMDDLKIAVDRLNEFTYQIKRGNHGFQIDLSPKTIVSSSNPPKKSNLHHQAQRAV